MEMEWCLVSPARENPITVSYTHLDVYKRQLYQEILESIEQTIRNSEVRRQSYYVENKEDHRTLLTRFGNLEIKRAYYSSKQDGKGV